MLASCPKSLAKDGAGSLAFLRTDWISFRITKRSIPHRSRCFRSNEPAGLADLASGDSRMNTLFRQCREIREFVITITI